MIIYLIICIPLVLFEREKEKVMLCIDSRLSRTSNSEHSIMELSMTSEARRDASQQLTSAHLLVEHCVNVTQ